MIRRVCRSFVLTVTVLGGLASHASAATITQPLSNPSQLTNWDETQTFNRFDPSLGTLTQIDVQLDFAVSADVQLENTTDAPSSSVVTWFPVFTLLRPDNTLILVAAPGYTDFGPTALLSAYDGTTDYGGSSGVTFTATRSDSRNATLLSPTDLALFSGIGTIGLPLFASMTGGGLTAAQIFTGFAGATVTLTYTYTPTATPVPEPASLSLLGTT